MSVQNVQAQVQHWRDRAIQKSEVISDAWQVFLAFTGRAAEIILFICMVFSLLQMLPGLTLWGWLANGVLITQMITLDVAGFGLNSMAKAVRRGGGTAIVAEKAETTATFLISIMVLSALSVAIDHMFGTKHPVVHDVMTYLDYLLILTRVVMTVLYGKVIHSLREAKQDMQQAADTTLADLQADNTRLSKALEDEQQANKKQTERIEEAHEKTVAELQEQLDGTRTECDHLSQKLSQAQDALTTFSQNGSTLQASLAESMIERNEQATIIQTLQNELLQVKAALESKNVELSHTSESLASASRKITIVTSTQAQKELSLKAEIDSLKALVKAESESSLKAGRDEMKAEMQAQLEELRRQNAQLKAQMKDQAKAPAKPLKQNQAEKIDSRTFVFECLRSNPEMKLSRMVEIAKTRSLDLSEPTASRYRKEYRESSNESSRESTAI
jgi:hypothetical protein